MATLVGMPADRSADELRTLYRRYNAACNAHEFDRLAAARIVELWVTADNLRLLDQLR